MRAGLVRKLGPGSFAWLPSGFRILARLAALLRRELETLGAVEVHAPEGALLDLIRRDLRSYRQLPIHLFHFPGGARLESLSLHRLPEEGDAAAREMRVALGRILEACGLPGVFLIESEAGETAALRCLACGYAAGVETAKTRLSPLPAAAGTLAKVSTPGQRTVEEVTRFLGVPAARLVKTLIYQTERGLVAALVRGDRALDEAKLRRALGTRKLALAGEETVREVTGAPVGFAGPVGLTGVRVIGDESVRDLSGFVCGANDTDAHYTGVRWEHDAERPAIADLLRVQEGDPCPHCGTALEAFQAFEVVRIEPLGTAPAEEAECSFSDESGRERPPALVRGVLFLDRVLLAAAELHHDGDGLLWPAAIAPFDLLLIAINPGDSTVSAAAERLYGELRGHGLDVLYDDRDERPGAKFKDADLIGVPLRLVVGARSLAEGRVEIALRTDREKRPVPLETAAAEAVTIFTSS